MAYSFYFFVMSSNTTGRTHARQEMVDSGSAAAGQEAHMQPMATAAVLHTLALQLSMLQQL